MAELTEQLRRYGMLQRQREVLPMVALSLARAARRREINEGDAQELYLEYFKASTGLKKPSAASAGVKVNTSKMRQIIKAADPDLLLRAKKIHDSVWRER